MHLADYPYIYKENADIYLDALARIIYETYGNIQVKMLIAGGSAIIFKHTFRLTSEDIDAYIQSSVDITDQILYVAQEYGIPTDWLNSDFTKSSSASPYLLQNAQFYKSYRGEILQIYLVCDLDLICMKLVYFRDKDTQDLVDLFKCNPQITESILLERIIFLYGTPDILRYDAKQFVTSLKLRK